MKKLRIGILYGGRSSEHEVSLASAAAIFANLDTARYDAIPLYIERSGRWTIADRPPTTESTTEVIKQARTKKHSHNKHRRKEIYIFSHPGDDTMLSLEHSPDNKHGEQVRITTLGLDVIFPVLHGPYGEDGTIQGLLELANIPYVGAGVMASAVGMDKTITKVVAQACGLPVADYAVVRKQQWTNNPSQILEQIVEQFDFPIFVKPAQLGSSVGVSRVMDQEHLGAAIKLAGNFDRKILIEAAVQNAREIECAVLGNNKPEASVPGEVIPAGDFYDYESKYIATNSQLKIPAPLSPSQTQEIRSIAIVAFRAIDAAGMARIDFLLDDKTGKIYLNEINTIPGFTTISMYAKLWEATGLDYPTLLDRLVQLGLEKHAEKQSIHTGLS